MRKLLTFKVNKQNILVEPAELDLSANSSLKSPHTLSNPWMKSLMLISVVYLSNVIRDTTYGVTLHYADSVCDIPRVLWIFYNLDFFKRKKLCCTVTSQSCYILNMTKLCNKLTAYIQMHNTHFCLSFHLWQNPLDGNVSDSNPFQD